MKTLEQIEQAVRSLTPEQEAEFRAWYAEYDAKQWDKQIESDVASGKLDWLIEEAKSDLREGRCTDR